jgi:hypothetical protein
MLVENDRGQRDDDLAGVAGAAETFFAGDTGPDTAVFDSGRGSTVIYQTNGYPDQFANRLLSSADAVRGVVVFWNVNSVREFSLGEAGEQVGRRRGRRHADREYVRA